MEKIEYIYFGKGVSAPTFERVQCNGVADFRSCITQQIDYVYSSPGSIYRDMIYEIASCDWINYFGSLSKKISKDEYYEYHSTLMRNGKPSILRFSSLSDYERHNFNDIKKNETITVYDDSDVTVEVPLSYNGNRILSVKTAWCIACKHKEFFYGYIYDSIIFYITNKVNNRIRSSVNKVNLVKKFNHPIVDFYVNSHGLILCDSYINIDGSTDPAHSTAAVDFLIGNNSMNDVINAFYECNKHTWAGRIIKQ